MRFLAILIFVTNLISCVSSQTTGFDLNTLPSDWVRLTETDSGLIVYNTCDAGNRIITITKDSFGFGLLLHGLQEDYNFKVLNSHLQDSNQVLINAQWKDSDEKQDFTFSWIDKENLIGKWTTNYSSGWTTDYNYTTLDNQLAFLNIDQPCSECWDDECDLFPIEIIRKIFEGYVKYNESTDSDDNKKAILENIRKIKYSPGVNDYQLLINVWMYYDPTDFAVQPDVYEVFKLDIEKSIKMINYRIDNPKEWENNNSAPYSELKDLINRLKNE